MYLPKAYIYMTRVNPRKLAAGVLVVAAITVLTVFLVMDQKAAKGMPYTDLKGKGSTRKVSPDLKARRDDPEEKFNKAMGMRFGFNDQFGWEGKHHHYAKTRPDEMDTFVAMPAGDGAGVETRMSGKGVKSLKDNKYSQWHKCRHECIASNRYPDPEGCVNECDSRFFGTVEKRR
jgi:hypothetical protein